MIQFDEERHLYTVDNIEIPGVSEVLSSVGKREKCKTCHGEGCSFCQGSGYTPFIAVADTRFCKNEVASNFGKQLHKYIALQLMGVNSTYDKKMQPWIDGWVNFMEDYDLFSVVKRWKDVKLYGVERILYSNLFKYCGTPDFYFWDEDWKFRNLKNPVLIDWKSSVSIAKTTKYQTAAYEALIKDNENIHKRFTRITVRIFEGEYETDIRTVTSDWSGFLSVLNVHKNFK